MLAGAAIAVVVVVVVLRVIVVAASGSVVVTSFLFGISSNIFGEAPSHFTRKWRARVDQEATTSGEFFFRDFRTSLWHPNRIYSDCKTIRIFRTRKGEVVWQGLFQNL